MSKADGSLFILRSGEQLMFVLVYVDDIIVTGNDSQAVDQFVSQLNARFSLKDLGKLNYFLGIEVQYTAEGVYLLQTKYIQDLLCKASMDQSNSLPTPMVTNYHLSAIDGIPINDEHQYRNIVGTLQYVVITRPDITYSVNNVC